MNSDGSVSLAELRDAAASLCPERVCPPKLFGKLSVLKWRTKPWILVGCRAFFCRVQSFKENPRGRFCCFLLHDTLGIFRVTFQIGAKLSRCIDIVHHCANTIVAGFGGSYSVVPNDLTSMPSTRNWGVLEAWGVRRARSTSDQTTRQDACVSFNDLPNLGFTHQKVEFTKHGVMSPNLPWIKRPNMLSPHRDLVFDKVYFWHLLTVRNGNGNLDISEFMAAVVSEAQCSWARYIDSWQFPEMTGSLVPQGCR